MSYERKKGKERGEEEGKGKGRGGDLLRGSGHLQEESS